MERTGKVYEIPQSDGEKDWHLRERLVEDLEKSGFYHDSKGDSYRAAYFLGDIVKDDKRIGQILSTEVISMNQSLDEFLETYQF